MWDLLIGIQAKVSATGEIGEIRSFGSEKGEKTVLLQLKNGFEKWILFSEVKFFESDFQRRMNEIDREILELQEKKFSLLNFFLVFPDKLLK